MLKRSLFISFFICLFIVARGQGKISISVFYDKASANDTLVLKLIHSYGETQYDLTYQAVQNAEHKFKFEIPVNEASGNFKIQKRRVVPDDTTPNAFETLTPVYLWENNDKIEVEINERKQKYSYDLSPYANHCYRFSGKGCEKYFVKNLVDSTLYYTPDMGMPVFIGKLKYTEGFEQAKKAAVRELDKFKGKLSPEAYHIIKSDILFYNSAGNYNVAALFFKKMFASGDSIAIRSFITSYNNSVLSKADYFEIPARYLAKSNIFLKYCLRRLNTTYFINHGTENTDSLYYEIKKQFKGSLKEQLIVAYFLNYRNSSDFNKLFSDAFVSISQPGLVEVLKKISLRLPGMQAYNFSFSDTSGKLIRLSDFRGKIVLMDFWFTGCGGCAHLYKDVLSKAKKTFENDTSVVFISVSSDVNKANWLRGIGSGLYTSPHSINLYTSGKGVYDPFIKNYSIWDFPTMILINDSMKIVKYNTNELYNWGSLINQIKTLQKENATYVTKKEKL